MTAPTETLSTPLTELLGITHPIFLAGMNVAAGPKLAAAVTNAGGMGVIGGIGYTPEILRKNIRAIKSNLDDPNAPFGVDLLLPQVGGSARKTNKDYTGGTLPQLIDIIIEEGAKLFVSAVGVPPKWAVDKLHEHGILCMNMIGAPKHVAKCLDVGVDIICAQGGEGGGHTGAIPTSLLIPAVVDLCRGRTSALTGGPVHVVAAGGITDGRGLAMAIAQGADAVWVGTRFVASEEAGAPMRHKRGVVNTGYDETIRTIIYTGRPMRVMKSDYIMNWEDERSQEIKDLTSQGILPVEHDMKTRMANGEEISARTRIDATPLLMGQAAGACHEILPARTIVNNMVNQAVEITRHNATLIAPVRPRQARL